MVANILDHIPDRIRDFPQRLHDVCVKAVGEYLPDPSRDPVESARKANREPLHRARKRARLVDFHDEVKVSPLDGVVHDAHAKPQLDLAKRILDGAFTAVAAQESHAGQHSHRDMDRVPRFELRPRRVRHTGVDAVLRFAASAWALATTHRKLHFDLLHRLIRH